MNEFLSPNGQEYSPEILDRIARKIPFLRNRIINTLQIQEQQEPTFADIELEKFDMLRNRYIGSSFGLPLTDSSIHSAFHAYREMIKETSTVTDEQAAEAIKTRRTQRLGYFQRR